MKVLILDNYDSFTWNLVQGLESAGGRASSTAPTPSLWKTSPRSIRIESCFLPVRLGRIKPASVPM